MRTLLQWLRLFAGATLVSFGPRAQSLTTSSSLMMPPRHLELSNGDRIAYHSLSGDISPGIVCFNGFRSSMSGRKATALEQYCRQANQSFVTLDYRGHGKSTGNFMNLALTDWIQDALHVLDTVTSGPQILVGSSMGAWIALHVTLHRPNRVVGIVGIGAAPDFTRDFHDKLSKEEKVALQREGVMFRPSLYSDEPYPITKKLLNDAETWYVMDKPSIPIKCRVHLIHGRDDTDVSFEQSVKLAELLESTNVQVTIIENGNHRLSESSDLEYITSAVKNICKLYVTRGFT